MTALLRHGNALHRLLRAAAIAALLAAAVLRPAWAAEVEGEGEITLQGWYWIDESGRASIGEVVAGAAKLQRMDRHRAFPLGDAVLWMRFELPARDASHHWNLLLSGAPFINRASLLSQGPGDAWREQRAGDH
ncbi:MAG: 7TM-DISM domain-containing protein, partial [Ramlibacter sp.]